MPRTTKLDTLRTKRTDALIRLKHAEEAHRAAVAALAETAALAAARRELEDASIAYIHEHERVQRRNERTQYEVREIDADGDAFNCWTFDTREEAISHATRLHGRGCASHAVAVERSDNGNRTTVWRRGSAAALDAWEDHATA